MFDYEYASEAFFIGGRQHRAFQIHLGEAHVGNGVDITFPDGSIAIRIFDYDSKLKDALHSFFKRVGVREVTFSRAL